ncbi:MAG: SRPBCC domain-containing protein [Fimbriimonadaceae bacterium]|nr:SRPBCC domain-containing protein [Fimbriimonadaceae bacterium]
MSRVPVAEKELTLVRLFDAPLDLVWEVWTEARHVKEWFGPHGFTNPVCEWNASPGGSILIHMQSPEGAIYPMTGTFHEVIKPTKLVFFASVPGEDGSTVLEGLATVTFIEKDGKTEMTLHDKGVGFAEAAKYMLEGMEEGWSQSFEKMATRLGELS